MQSLSIENIDSDTVGDNVILKNLEDNIKVYLDCKEKQRKSILVIQKLANPRVINGRPNPTPD
jgi:hypothetical protein